VVEFSVFLKMILKGCFFLEDFVVLGSIGAGDGTCVLDFFFRLVREFSTEDFLEGFLVGLGSVREFSTEDFLEGFLWVMNKSPRNLEMLSEDFFW